MSANIKTLKQKTTSPCGDSSTGGELGPQQEYSKFPSGGGVANGRGGLVSKSVISFNLPYNKKLVQRAKALRKSGSLPEALLWREIKSKKINGLDFDRQKVIGNYIVDFFCAGAGVVIEIDDKTHQMKEKHDAVRQKYLQSLNLRIIHISAKDVLKNPSSVSKLLGNILQVK